MVTMAHSAANWRNTHTHVDRTHPLTHLHQYSHKHVCAKRQLSYSAITKFGIEVYFEGTREWGSKPEYLEKTPDSMPANRYHVIEEKTQRPGRESNPHPPTLVHRWWARLAKSARRVWPTELHTAARSRYIWRIYHLWFIWSIYWFWFFFFTFYGFYCIIFLLFTAHFEIYMTLKHISNEKKGTLTKAV